MDNPNGENQENKQLQGDERPPRVEDELPEPPIMEDKPRNRSAGGIMENIWFKAIVAAVASVVVIVYALVPMFGGGSYVTKKDFEYNMGNISTTINDAVSTLNTKAAALDTALKSLPNDVKSAVASELATRLYDINEQVDDAMGDVSQYEATIDNLKTNSTTALQQIVDLSQSLDTLAVRIDSLELLVAELVVEEEEQAASPVTATIRQQTNYLMVNVSENVSYGVMRLTIENTSAKEVEDVVVSLYFNSTVIPTSGVVVGGMLPWLPSTYSALYFRSGGWGYTIKANSKLVFEVSVKFNNIGQAYYTAEAIVEGWSYK